LANGRKGIVMELVFGQINLVIAIMANGSWEKVKVMECTSLEDRSIKDILSISRKKDGEGRSLLTETFTKDSFNRGFLRERVDILGIMGQDTRANSSQD
jgi:hypothetical protein